MLTLSVLSWPATARAVKTDTIVLGNGDRITGEVKGLSRGKLDYSTDDAGRLSVEWERVARLQSPNLYEVELHTGVKLFGRLEAGTEDGSLVVRDTTAAMVPISSVVGITPLSAGFFQRVKAFLDMGLTLAKANQATTFSLSGEGEYRGPKMGVRLDYDSYAQGQEALPTTTRNSSSLLVGWFLPKRWSAFAVGSVEQNDELNLDVRFTGGGGLSRVLARSNSNDLSTAIGLVATKERFLIETDSTSSIDERSNLEGLLTVNWNAFRFDSPKLDFSTEVQVYPSLSESGRVRGDLTVRWKYEVFPDFNLGINFSDTFDSKPPDEDIEKNDYVTTFTIGWSYRR